MMIAKYATYENAEWTVESLKSVVDYIVEAFKAVKRASGCNSAMLEWLREEVDDG